MEITFIHCVTSFTLTTKCRKRQFLRFHPPLFQLKQYKDADQFDDEEETLTGLAEVDPDPVAPLVNTVVT